VAAVQYTFTHKQYTEYRGRNIHNNKKKIGKWWPWPIFASYTLEFALQLRKKHGKTSVRVRKTSVMLKPQLGFLFFLFPFFVSFTYYFVTKFFLLLFHVFFFKRKTYVGSTADISKSCNVASSYTRLNLSPFWGPDNPLSQINVEASIKNSSRLRTPAAGVAGPARHCLTVCLLALLSRPASICHRLTVF
jgi:hypothetical protein